MNRKLTGLTLTGFALPMLTTGALADPGSGFGGNHMGFGGWFFGPLMMILVIALTVGAVVLVLRWIVPGGDLGRTRGRPLDILNDRFARGEIDKSEFEERRRALVD